MSTRRIEHPDGSVESWTEPAIVTPTRQVAATQGAPTCGVHDLRMRAEDQDQHGILWMCPGHRCRVKVPWPRAAATRSW